jgi:UDP-2,3-diacylglucosamine pyrophosphatase LpxH
MKISVISDLHIVDKDDEGYKVLESFINHPLVQESEIIIFLGDILDFMVGEFLEYKNKYDYFFKLLSKLENKKVYYFTGNHDFKFNTNLFHKNITILETSLVVELKGTKILFAHGDNEEIENSTYKKYKNFIQSERTQKIVNSLPFSFINYLGKRASMNSKKRGKKVFNYDQCKEKFRDSAILQFQDGFNTVVFGHSHILDDYKYNNRKYLNCGFPSKDKKFIHITEDFQGLVSVE